MVSAKVIGIYTTDMEPLQSFCPTELDEFCVVVRAIVGGGSEGEESFDINVCTPKWVARQVDRDGFVWGRHYLLVSNYNPDQIGNVITKFFERYTGASWKEVAEKLARFALWEFEDYRESNL